MDDFRRELRSSDKPAEAPPTRQKVNVKVGTKVDKPADGPKTGRNKPTAEKRVIESPMKHSNAGIKKRI